MSAPTQNMFQPDAFETNRRGELSERQLQGLRALSRSRRRSALGNAAYFVAGAVLVGFFASASAPIVTRTVITFACVAIAAFLVVRSVTGSDALTRDLRNGHVQSVEGAIGRRRRASGRWTNYYLEVGKTMFKVSRVAHTRPRLMRGSSACSTCRAAGGSSTWNACRTRRCLTG